MYFVFNTSQDPELVLETIILNYWPTFQMDLKLYSTQTSFRSMEYRSGFNTDTVLRLLLSSGKTFDTVYILVYIL
jgi:hypothetical protein